MRYDVNNPYDENRDRLVVSKGHCVLAYYSVLNKVGFLTDKDIVSFETNGSHFHGHAMRNLENGIEFSGGSLSMGMTFAVGLALSCFFVTLRILNEIIWIDYETVIIDVAGRGCGLDGAGRAAAQDVA